MLVKTIQRQSEMCNFISFCNKIMTHEPKKNEWIKVIKRNKNKRMNSNCIAKMKPPKQQVKNLPKAKNHNSEFHPRIQMKKGTTRDFSQQMAYGPKFCQSHLHIQKKSKTVKAFSNKKPLSWKDRRHLQSFDISKTILHPLSNEPTLSLPNNKEETGVQSPIVKDETMGDWFVREFGEWFHTKVAKMHREQLKRNGEITWL
jgi:hypothetical protein